MDINEYMGKNLALLERIAVALESQKPTQVTNQTSTPATVEKEKPATVEKEKPTTPKKPTVTVEDARKALKAYAAIEGNDSAMELLAGFGVSSMSALAEKGEEALAALIAQCKE